MIEIQNIAMDGTDKEFVVPDNTASLAIQITGGDVVIKTAAGGAEWSMTDGSKEAISSRTAAGQTILFNGTGTVQIRLLKGMLS